MYNNPNLNILLMSPGRTGSLLILSFLSSVAKITPIVRYDRDNLEPLKPKEILHSHTPEDVKLSNKDTLFILSTRNLIDSTFSRIIGRKTNRWRYYRSEGSIQPFHVSIDDYLNAYKFSLDYYNTLQYYLPKKYIRVDYSQFSDNAENLLDILNIPKISYKFASKNLIPTKTPGTYRDWIINYDEVNAFAQTLKQNPPI
jgi:hypothetical protein